MWVTEVEFTHQDRLLQILKARGVQCSVKVGNLKGEATLILSKDNLSEPGVLPVDCYKYIFKTFHAPYQCRDPYWFRFHPVVKELIQRKAVLRVQCVPKSMGTGIVEALIGEEEMWGVLPQNISFANHTHIFQCFYSVENACFYWGVASVDDPTTQSASWLSLHQAVVNSYVEKNITPVCRAYYKMQEIVEHYFPLWSWEMPRPFHAVDIGASPGGWTQYISVCMKAKKVLAVDPGDIQPDILGCQTCSVTHCRALAEAPATADSLLKFGGFALCVCDINCDAWVAIDLLIKHVLPYSRIFCSNDVKNSNFGYLILTLKLAKKPKEKHVNRAVNFVIDALSQTPSRSGDDDDDSGSTSCKRTIRGWDFKVVHLNANSRNERTVICKFGVLELF